MDNAKFVGNIPNNYDQHLGPVFFEPYADDLSQRVVAVTPEGPVLETACGTGRLTKHLRDKLLNTAKLVSTDLNQAMIDIARQRLGDIDVEWQEADACALPFPDRTFSAVVNQFGLMFVPDKRTAIHEAARVLKGGGLFAFNIWDSKEENPVAQITERVVNSFFTHDPPTFYQVPFGFSDSQMWIDWLDESGFTNIEVHKLPMNLVSESAESFATGLVLGNPIAMAIEERNLQTEKIVAAVAEELVKLGGDHPVRTTMQAFVYTARTK